MKLKLKDSLALQFTFLFAVLLLCVLTGIYLFVAHNRVNSFFDRLDERTITAAQFYLAEDNLSKEKFENVIRKFPQSLPGENIRIYDDRFNSRFIPGDNIKWDVAVLKDVVAKKQLHLKQGDRQVAAIYYADNSGNFIIVVSAYDLHGARSMAHLRLIMFFFFMASLIITFFIGRGFARIALLPIVRMTNNLKTIRSTSLDLRLPVAERKTDEIDVLSTTINQLLEHLEQSFEGQKSFIANASHELRTPITTILGEAETTLMFDRDKEAYKSSLSNIIKETERLIYLINSLMELMQTNIANYDFQPVRIDELMGEIKNDIAGKLSKKCIIVKYSLPADITKHQIQGNHQLLLMGIGNIIKNGLKFSDNKEIYCDIFYDTKGLNILIRDQGIGIEHKDLAKIFQPFFRSANALRYPGYGIGLSLTSNIIRLHNGIINVRSKVNEGTEFHIIFPSFQ